MSRAAEALLHFASVTSGIGSSRPGAGNARRPRNLQNQRHITPNSSANGSARIGAVVNGSGRIFASRSRIEKNDQAAINNAKQIRHRWRARRGPRRGRPNRMTRTSPAAATSNTVAMMKDIIPIVRNGTPLLSIIDADLTNINK
jgi:hypothetical protein